MQGLGRPIVGLKRGDSQFVSVGCGMRYGNWKTFEDFLDANLKAAFTAEWAELEKTKEGVERHPIFLWLDAIAEQRESDPGQVGEIKFRREIGASAAYFGLAYNLYLLEHNAELQHRLLKRLRQRSEFHGAYYETFVAAYFILAGFTLTVEDEDNANSTHCEFCAVDSITGKTYWVEAKTREPRKNHFNVANQLYKGLRKRAEHERVIFIDLNVEDSAIDDSIGQALADNVHRRESMTIDGAPAPAAFVMITNHPAHLNLSGSPGRRMLVQIGYKTPDFGHGVALELKEAFAAKQRHAGLYSVARHAQHYSIPSTFDGELPEFAFGLAERRWTVGDAYLLGADDYGPCTLESAVAIPEKSQAALIFAGPDGHRFICFDDLTEHEISAYRRHPETFFGAYDRNAKQGQINDPLSLFEFLYQCYKQTPRQKLLEFFSSSADHQALTQLDDEDLLREYCARNVAAMLAHKQS